ADGQDYPLVIGSNTFIPGFEPELVGLKTGEEKSFDIVFPKDYATKDLQSKKVTFTVTAKKVQEVVLPKLNDAFAAKVGPFKQVSELRADVRRQLQAEKQMQANRAFENEILATVAQKSTVAIPDSLVNEEIERLLEEEKRNLVYRGTTWQEYLKAEGKTEEEHREGQREIAETRVKTGLVLAEIAEVEQVGVTKEELEERVNALKKQYTDPQMQEELNKPENRREIASRLLTEKTIATLAAYVDKK
ncbi:MAG TPA: trigger factor, partial [Methylococcales bacterium]